MLSSSSMMASSGASLLRRHPSTRLQQQQTQTQSLRRRLVIRADAPKTGQHTIDDALQAEALGHFFRPEQAPRCSPTSGGVNNCVSYVDVADGSRWILRVYNNGNKTAKVETEHAILAQLAQQQLSFKVPTPLPTLDTRAPFVVLSSGAAACVFETIPGELAKTTSPAEVGRATGELVAAMSKVDLGDRDIPVPPYFKLFEVHHSIMEPQVFYNEAASNPAFNVCREAMDYLVGQIRAIEPLLDQLPEMGLAQQLIHGDLHFDNVMVLGDMISGLLDFEFCARDLRIMELAVALSKYVGEEQPMPLIEQFVEGYVRGGGPISEQEAQLLPDLINLRIHSNTVYFTGRAMAGEDGIESLTSRAASYAKRVRFVNDNRQALVDRVLATMAAHSGAAAAAPAVAVAAA